MKSARKYLSIAMTGTVVAGALAAALSAAPAHASPAECTNGANGFVSIPYNKTGTPVEGKSAGLGGGRRVELHYGTVSGAQRGWAIIRGTTQRGDEVWMDWTTTGRVGGWLRCGPFVVQNNGSTNTSAAQRTSSDADWQFRACGRRVGGPTVCGAWW